MMLELEGMLAFGAGWLLYHCLIPQHVQADRDGDGEVNEEEFFRIMKKTSLF
jgi:EF hand